MKLLFVVLLVLLGLSYFASAQSIDCFYDENNDYCMICESVGAQCNGQIPSNQSANYLAPYRYCVNTTDALPEDSPCDFIEAGDLVCGTNEQDVSLAYFSQQNFEDWVNGPDSTFEDCMSSNTTNHACCQRSCRTAECFCPIACTGVVDVVLKEIAPRENYLICYDDCVACDGYGYSESYCTSQCESQEKFKCNNDRCCSVYPAAGDGDSDDSGRTILIVIIVIAVVLGALAIGAFALYYYHSKQNGGAGSDALNQFKRSLARIFGGSSYEQI